MRRSAYLAGLVMTTFLGCQALNLGTLSMTAFKMSPSNLRSQNPETETGDESGETPRSEIHTKFIGDFAVADGLHVVLVEGVGLVTGLDGTGGDSPPSPARQEMLTEMRRRGIKMRKANRILAAPSTALVIVRGYLPPLVRKKDRFDVEVRLPEGSEATSLRGGWLLKTRLLEQAIVPGRGTLSGDLLGVAEGPVLVASAKSDAETSLADRTRGHVLGGAVSAVTRSMSLRVKSKYQSVHMTTQIEHAVNQRFYHTSRSGLRAKVAVAKDDKVVQLQIMPRYRDNFPRYLSVIRNIPIGESEVAADLRMQRLEEKLKDPPKSAEAAVQLEAIGRSAAPILKRALKESKLEVRFHAATALAYLGRPDGLEVLAEAARREPAFRVFALAAMAVVEAPQSHMLLRELLHEESAETRYGAFRALSTLDPYDPFIQGETLNDQFSLHVLETEGPPLVHVTHRKKSEIVLFGASQRFKTPLAVRAGNDILVKAAPGSETITISRFEIGKDVQKATVSTRIAEVIRTITSPKFGAPYPDVVQMLVEADRQRNLPGRIAIDALPQAGRVYRRPQEDDNGDDQTKIGRSSLIPNLFSEVEVDVKDRAGGDG